MDIQSLIASGQTEQALELMIASGHPDGTLLKARHFSGNKNYNMGLIGFEDWSRLQAQINFAILESCKTKVIVNVQNTNNVTLVYNYVNFEREPGNDQGIVNKVFRSLKAMVEDEEYPIHEIGKVVAILNGIFGISDLVDLYEDFNKTSYLNNSEAFKTAARKAFVQNILADEEVFKATIKEIVAKEQSEVSWKEAYELLLKEATYDRWHNLYPIISERLNAPIFNDSQRKNWLRIVEEMNTIQPGLLWKRAFMAKIADLKTFVTGNVYTW